MQATTAASEYGRGPVAGWTILDTVQSAQATHVGRLLVGQAHTVKHHVCSLDRIAHSIHSAACITNGARLRLISYIAA